MNEEETIQVVEFVLNHEQNILDGVSDFSLLLPYLKFIKENMNVSE